LEQCEEGEGNDGGAGSVSRTATAVAGDDTGLAAAKKPRERTTREEKNFMLEMGWWWMKEV
jgi:hypothetical protein